MLAAGSLLFGIAGGARADVGDQVEIDNIGTGLNSWGCGVDSNGDCYWVDNVSGVIKSRAMPSYNLSTEKVIGTMQNGSNYKGLALNEDFIWVVSDGDDKIYKLDKTTGNELGSFSVPSQHSDIRDRKSVV